MRTWGSGSGLTAMGIRKGIRPHQCRNRSLPPVTAAQCGKPMTDFGRRIKGPNRPGDWSLYRISDAAECGKHAENRHISSVIADEHRIAARKWRAFHHHAHRLSFV